MVPTCWDTINHNFYFISGYRATISTGGSFGGHFFFFPAATAFQLSAPCPIYIILSGKSDFSFAIVVGIDGLLFNSVLQ